MPSLKSLVAATLLAGSVVAQNSTTPSPDGTSIPQIIAENQANVQDWCTAQFTTCSTLCGGPTSADSCDVQTLEYNCTCQDASIVPALDKWMNTVPYFICVTRRDDCVKQYVGSAVGQANCRTTFSCATQDPTNYTLPGSSTASGSSPTGTGSTSPSGSTKPSGSTTASAGSTSPTKSPAMKLGQDYGMGIFAAVFLGAMSLVL